MTHLRPFHLLLFLAFVPCGCGAGAPSAPAPIDRDTYVRLTADRMVLEEELRLAAVPPGGRPDTALLSRRVDSLYGAYRVSRGAAEETERWYKADPGRWRGLEDLVAKRLEILEERERTAVTPPPGAKSAKH